MPAPRAPAACLEVMVLTVCVWISLWGSIDVLVRRLQLKDDAELALYLTLGLAALVCVWLWDGVDACALL